MKKNGFTLVELLGVITILAIVAVLGSYSISAVSKTIKTNLWNNKIKLIENGAASFGEDNRYLMMADGTSKCTFMESEGEESYHCLEITIDYLLKRNYVTTDDRDSKDNKVMINDATGESVNDKIVYIWLENNIVYAKYGG